MTGALPTQRAATGERNAHQVCVRCSDYDAARLSSGLDDNGIPCTVVWGKRLARGASTPTILVLRTEDLPRVHEVAAALAVAVDFRDGDLDPGPPTDETREFVDRPRRPGWYGKVPAFWVVNGLAAIAIIGLFVRAPQFTTGIAAVFVLALIGLAIVARRR